MALLSSLDKNLKEKYTPSLESAPETPVLDLKTFLESKPVVEEETQEETTTETTSTENAKHNDTPTNAPETEETKTEPIGFDGAPIHDISSMQESILGTAISNPKDITDLIMIGIELVRNNFLPGFYFKIMFKEQERSQLEEILSKYIDIDAIGESSELMPLKKGIEPTEEENELLWKWRKYLRAHKSLAYSEKDKSTIKNIIYERVKLISVDTILAKYDWVLALVLIEGSKASPFLMNRKQSVLSKFTDL